MAELDTNVKAETETETVGQAEVKEQESKADNAEIARLKAELTKAQNKNDALAKENAEKAKQLRAKQTAEEAAAEEAKAQQDALMQELETLRKERAVASTTAKIIPLVTDSVVAGQVAEYLYGAEDVDSAIAAIQKAWAAKEKALRLEYGKIPAPGTGASEGPTYTREQVNAMKYEERVKFAREHRDEYNKLMGR